MDNVLTLDLRSLKIPCEERHRLVTFAWDELRDGEHFIIQTDHDPQPLRQKLNQRSRGRLRWTYLESGPRIYRIQIEKPVAHQQNMAAS